jgi:hypothetical protein
LYRKTADPKLLGDLIDEANQILSIIVASIKTAREAQ